MDMTDKRFWMRVGASLLAIFVGVSILQFAILSPINIFGIIVAVMALSGPILIFKKYPLVASALLFLTALLAFFLTGGFLATIALGGAGALAYFSTINERNRVGRL